MKKVGMGASVEVRDMEKIQEENKQLHVALVAAGNKISELEGKLKEQQETETKKKTEK